jgi:uncharacterized alpha/beta hydrolase family protein
VRHTLDDYSERIEDVLEQIVSSQHLEKVMVIGYSMGLNKQGAI